MLLTNVYNYYTIFFTVCALTQVNKMKSSNPKNNNPKGNPETLTPYKPKWKSGKTRTIRVPIAKANEILKAAELIDSGYSLTTDTGEQTQNEEVNREKVIQLAEEAFSSKSNAGGKIKDLLSQILLEHGYSLIKEKRSWKVEKPQSVMYSPNVLK